MSTKRGTNKRSPVRVPDCFGGPLASHIGGFEELLVREGYAAQTVKVKCALATALSRWLQQRRLSLRQLDEQRIKQFHTWHPARPEYGDVSTGHQLLKFLRHLGVVCSLAQTEDKTALGQLTREYERFLRLERGLSPVTVIGYMPFVRRFLTEHFANRPLRFQQLQPQDLHRFIVRQILRTSRSSTKLAVTALRSFMRFLLQRGRIKTDLACALLGVANRQQAHLPKALPPEQVRRLLHSCDRCTPAGQRDYAILLLLARLGLRGGEVLAMTLDDLDWERGTMLVRGKSHRLERLPLPKEAGTALIDYLRHVRPACASRRVFIRLRAPQRPPGSTAICTVVRRALRRAGLNPDFKGAHLLRHSLATDMLRRGASLGEIGQLLRHQQPTTTQIYAKVDIEALRRIALPWMDAAP